MKLLQRHACVAFFLLHCLRCAAAEPTTGIETMPTVEVTGSRIARVDAESIAPVAVFSAADLAARGSETVGDFVQSLALESGTQNATHQTNSFIRGAATANPRGLGANRFLLLVNGRRPAAFAIPTSANRPVFDLNSLPAAAIESIEVLKDGASAIYGADAMTGVMNIKLRRQFSGLAITGRYSNTLRGSGADTQGLQLSVVAGGVGPTTRVMTAFSARTAHSSYLRDYGLTDADYSYLGANKGLNQNSTFVWPANLSLTRAQATALGLAYPATTATSWTYLVQGGVPTAVPTLTTFAPAPANPANPAQVLVGNENRYNPAPGYALNPAYDYISDFTTMERQFGAITLFGDVTLGRNSTYYNYTPSVVSYAAEGLTLPGTSPYNPFGIPLTTLTGRTSFGPASKFDMVSTTVQLVAGARGRIGESWQWQTAGTLARNDVGMTWRNAIRKANYQAALNGTAPGFAGRFLNPFGPSDAALTASLFTDTVNTYRQQHLMWDVGASGTVCTLPSGVVGLAVGVEHRTEKLSTNSDTTPFIGGGGANSLSGDRGIASAYAEATVPVFRGPRAGALEVQLAGRHERYSDFGNTTNPKFAGKWALPQSRMGSAALRASYARSFQAPALAIINATRTVGLTAALQDPLRPQDPPAQQRVVTGGNPDLQPETGRTRYVGLQVDRIASIPRLSVAVDYFDIRIDGVIVTPSAAFLLTERGRAQFPNALVRDSTLGNPGPIVRIEAVPQNNPAAFQVYRGFDYTLRYAVPTRRWGEFSLLAEATQIVKTGADSGLGGGFTESTGLYYSPEWKANALVRWTRARWAAAVAVDWTGRYVNTGYTTTGWGENPQTLVHANMSYDGLLGCRWTLGASNLFDRRPPLNGREIVGFDPKVYGAMATGRVLYVQAERKF